MGEKNKQEILRLVDVHYQYDDGNVALSGIHTQFFKNEKVAVLGNNGAGKSTFFFLCNGVFSLSTGSIFLNNHLITNSKKDLNLLRQNIGLVFQDSDVQMIGSTVYEEIGFGPMNLGYSKEEVRKRVDEVVQNLELSDYVKRAPHCLSGGEKKRVCIGDALAMDPQMLFFDEPTTGLDSKNIMLFEENLKSLENRGIGVVIATHDVDFAWRFADRILIFHEGKILADGDPYDIFTNREILEESGLIQPTLVQIGIKLGWKQIPKNLEEFQKMSL